MNDSTTYTIASYTPAKDTRIGGYSDGNGNLHTVPVAVYGEYDGNTGDVQSIVAWVKEQADQFLGAGTWEVDGVDIKASDDDEADMLRVFMPGYSTPINLDPYIYYLDTEEEADDEEDDEEEEQEERDYAPEAPALTPSYMGERFAEIVQTTGQALFDNIVANVPTSEDDLRERFEQFGLLA